MRRFVCRQRDTSVFNIVSLMKLGDTSHSVFYGPGCGAFCSAVPICGPLLIACHFPPSLSALSLVTTWSVPSFSELGTCRAFLGLYIWLALTGRKVSRRAGARLGVVIVRSFQFLFQCA